MIRKPIILVSLIVIFAISSIGSSNKEIYGPFSIRLNNSILRETKKTLLGQFGHPHIRENNKWYYLASPGYHPRSIEVAIEIRFDKYNEVDFYSERYYEEYGYYDYFPGLIESLRSRYKQTRERAYWKIQWYLSQTVYVRASRDPATWCPIPENDRS